MTLRRRLTEVRAAEARVAHANARVDESLDTVQSWIHRQPLVCVGVAVGAGWTWGRLATHPWRAVGTIRLLCMQVLPWVSRVAAMAREPT